MSASTHSSSGHIRIGELSRRVGVSAELLRAWERRYELLSPSRTAGGLRLYGDDDERRVMRMLEHLDAGVSAAEAAQLTRAEFEEVAPALVDAGHAAGDGTRASRVLGDELRQALDQLDDTRADAALDRLLSGFSLETVLRDAVLPYLHELGERWERRGDEVIAQEHFASALLRGRLLALGRGWGGGHGPMALLACFPGDQHDLGLICFGLALRGNGWRITFLGPDIPLATITETARLLSPAMVVLTANVSRKAALLSNDLREVAAHAPLALAGRGVSVDLAKAVGAVYLDEDPIAAAARIAGAPASSRPTTARGRAAKTTMHP